MSQRLSARQEECLKLTAFLTDKEIAGRLGLSEATVKKHVHEACRRLGVNRRKAALALLQRNVPEATKDPMAQAHASGLTGAGVSESDHAISNQASSPLDVGRSGGRAEYVQPPGVGRPRAGASDAGAGGRRGGVEPAGTAPAGAERGLGDGPGRSPERRLGYVPPPANRLARILTILLMIVLCAVVMKGLADLGAAYASQAGEIHRLTSPTD